MQGALTQALDGDGHRCHADERVQIMIESGDGWFVADSAGMAQGPLTRAQLQALRDAGTVSDEHLVWTLREAEWVPLRRALGIRYASADLPGSGKSQAARAPATELAQPPKSAATTPPAARAKPPAGKAPLPGTGPAQPSDDWRKSLHGKSPAAVADALLASAKSGQIAEKRERAAEGLRRLVARQIDLAVLGGIGWALLSVIGLRLGLWTLGSPQSELQEFGFFVPALLLLAALPLEAVAVGLSGYTPGRLLLGLRVVDRMGSAPGLNLGWQRAVRVALLGQALLIMPFSLVAYGVAFAGLVGSGRTHWDRALNLTIRSTPLSANRWSAALFGLAIAWSLWYQGVWMRLAYEALLAL